MGGWRNRRHSVITGITATDYRNEDPADFPRQHCGDQSRGACSRALVLLGSRNSGRARICRYSGDRGGCLGLLLVEQDLSLIGDRCDVSFEGCVASAVAG